MPRARTTPALAVVCPHCGWREREVEVHRVDLALAGGDTHYLPTDCTRCRRDFVIEVCIVADIRSLTTMPPELAALLGEEAHG